METPQVVLDLVDRFECNRDVYCSNQYNETQTRHEFIDPFFMTLGWDVNNEKGYAEAYKEVIHEDAIKVGGATKAPDYSFRLGGVRKFFVEAKRPGVNIKDDENAAYQLRRYAWSAKLPLSILTDFEEFAVYDCRVKPDKADKASTARVLYLTLDKYAEKWDEIEAIFSQEAIWKGSFDKYIESTKRKKGTAEVDTAFLKEIEAWRDVLARNIALRNTTLSTRELNFAVQRTIDRLIFLRICEDRGIETYGQLMALQSGMRSYQRLCQIFRHADERYNSGLFHFQREKDRPEPPDGLTLSLAIDDKALKGILKELYYPESPYEFSVLPADILGQVYEQFLGKVIRLTPAHRAVVEDKPEVKKAGGVYYTPTYIVDYIVEHTVEKLLDGKTPNEVAKLRVLDPACGSGSFLLGAYQTLLDWHLKWYSEHEPEKHTKGRQPKIFRGPGGDWRLTTSEKKRILLNSIYGVDIDPQAVEVTKLSLLLKVLEGENAETLGKSLRLFHERALPDLANNIKCGNSLIGPDFYEGKQLSLIDEEERYRINAFDWNAEFPEIMQAGGFDAVIGNPPWVSLKGKFANDICTPDELDYLTRAYVGDTYRPNVYEYFVKRAISLAKTGGFQAFVVPDRLGFNQQFSELRFNLAKNGRFVSLLYKARFPGVIADTLVYVYMPRVAPESNVVQVGDFHGVRASIRQERFLEFQDYQFLPVTPVVQKVYFDLRNTVPLGQAVSSSVGFIARAKTITEEPISRAQQPILRGRNILRYATKGEAYFEFAKKDLVGGTQDPEKLGAQRKILMRKTGFPLLSTLDSTGRYPEQSLYFLYKPVRNLSLEYILGIVNSALFQHIYWVWMVTNRDATPQLKKIHLDQFPIRKIEFSDSVDKARHERMVELVDTVLKLHKDLQTAKTDHEKSLIQRQIDTTDKQIDKLVYELYGLTDKEIHIVEETT